MKKFLFTILILLALGGIGAGLYLYFSPQKTATPGQEFGFQEFSPLDIAGTGSSQEDFILTGEEVVSLEEIVVPSDEVVEGAIIRKINKVSDRNIAGYSMSYDNSGALSIYYVDGQSGNIFKKILNKDGVFGGEERLTTNIIPFVREAFFGLNNTKIILRYTKEDKSKPSGFSIETFLGDMPKTGLELKGLFLEENIADLSVSPDGTKLFYLVENGSKTVGINYDLSTNKKTQIFSSSFLEWISQYINTRSILLTAKASSEAPGSIYLLDISSKNSSKVLGGINGLTSLGSPSGKNILYTKPGGELNIFNSDNKTSSLVGLNSLSEKCVWSKGGERIYCGIPGNLSGQIPDAWYKGLLSFNDSFWDFSLSSGSTSIIMESKDLPESFDSISLKLDSEEKYLFFLNKKDLSLWLISLK